MSQLALPMEWCQRWRDREHSWRHRSEGGFDRLRYRVAPLASAAAKAFVQAHHYSGTFPAEKVSLGMFEGDQLVGVAVFAVPVRAEVLTRPFPGLEPYRQSIELSRFVLLDEVPANAETWFLARAFDHLRLATDIRGVLAFSDPQPRRRGTELLMPGHWGTIYQAKGATYLGRARARMLTVLPDGTVLNDRARAKLVAGDRGWRHVAARLVDLGAVAPVGVPDVVWLAEALQQIGAERVRHGGNLRYAFPLERRVRLGMEAEPFPKRY